MWCHWLLLASTILLAPSEIRRLERFRPLKHAALTRVTIDREVNGACLQDVPEGLVDRYGLKITVSGWTPNEIDVRAQERRPLGAFIAELAPQMEASGAITESGVEFTINTVPESSEFDVGGTRRTAIVIPPTKNSKFDPPLVLVFHGHGGTARGAAERLQIQSFWPEAVVVYPQGLPGVKGRTDPEGKLAGWQNNPGEFDDRDLKFVDKLLQEIQKSDKFDSKRVYAMGHSNGARFSAVLWKMRPDSFAAFCCCAGQGGLMIKDCQPKPIMMIAGEVDQLVPVTGQRMSMGLARMLLKADPAKATTDGQAKIEPGIKGTELVTYIHPGGHEFPKTALPVAVGFFRRHEKK